MKRKFLGLVSILLATLACGVGTPATSEQPGVETIVAATFEALTSAAPATEAPVSGTTIAVNNISFVVPTGIGTGAEAETVEAALPADDMPWWATYPTHQQYEIQGYVLQDTFHQPAIYVYPVDEYKQMNEDVGTGIDQLRTILASPDQPLPERLPFLPTFNAGQVFYSNTEIINFQSGSGIRYITQYDQAPFPINNHEVFYTFQGMTSDGKYYVAAILPINTATLAADGNPESATPAGGIPFDWDPDSFELLPDYIDSVKQLLNATDPNAFNPTLPALDGFIQTITVASQ